MSDIGDETATNFSIIETLRLKDNDFKLSNSVYLVGGASKSNSSLNILRYDIDENKWFDLGISYEMIKGGSILLHNGNIALIGGKDVSHFFKFQKIEKWKSAKYLRIQPA